ncbi:MAG TPA: HD domain-containing protein [Patescibacteria group bacterium]|nr:HD domain-containing protein [Patescibacteria group bacterium]
MDFLSKKMLDAVQYTARMHDGQYRRGPSRIPFISHPFAVGMALVQAGFEEDVIIAGILHDVVEDTTATLEDVRREFGERVAHIVDFVTEDPNLQTVAEKKAAYRERLKVGSVESLAVSCADLLANRTSLYIELLAGINWDADRPRRLEMMLGDDHKRLSIIKERLTSDLVSNLDQRLEEISNFLKNYNGKE